MEVTPKIKPLIRPVSLPMGEIAVARDSGILRTLLGSCLGLTLYDRRLRLGALAHIVLPDSLGRNEHPGKYVDTAVPEMIRRMVELVDGQSIRLTAKIAGGANMFSTPHADKTIGVQNLQAVEQILETFRIPITARNCGGEQGRRMTFDTTTGSVAIDVVGAETLMI